MIIGLVGLPASGKGTITEYLVQKHNAKSVRFSQPLRDIIHRLFKEETRENMSRLAQFLRKEFGNDILVRTLVKDIEQMDAPLVVFDGIRYFDEYNVLRERKDFVLWAVEAPLSVRHTRISGRGENADDGKVSLEEFKKQHELETERVIPEIMKHAKEHIDNSTSKEDLLKHVDSILDTYDF